MLWYLSTNWSSVRSGNAGSKTPIAILRREPGAEVGVPCVCGAVAPRACGAATAPAITPPVVARKFLRAGDSGSKLLAMKFLKLVFQNPESRTARTLYARQAQVGGTLKKSVVKKPKPPLLSGFGIVG